MKWRYLIIVLLLGVLLIGGNIVVNLVERGKRVTESTQGDDGVILEHPDTLSQLAGVDVEVYSLARMIASEEETRVVPDPNYLIGVAWVVRNEANARGISITDLLTSSKRGGGFYGRQSVGPRYASTWEDPYERDITIAQGVLSGTIWDVTEGARHFFAPATQDKLHAKDPTRYKSSEELIASWGGTPVDVPNVDPAKLMFIRIG